MALCGLHEKFTFLPFTAEKQTFHATLMLENVRMLDDSEKAPSIKQKRKQKRKQNRLVQPWTTVARRQLDFDSANTQFVQF